VSLAALIATQRAERRIPALGAGCADWSCETSITFARTWHQTMGLTHDFHELYLTSLPVDIDDG
jgi:hypothetical protein